MHDALVDLLDDQTAIKLTDGTVEVVSEGHWKLFPPVPKRLSGFARDFWPLVAETPWVRLTDYPRSR